MGVYFIGVFVTVILGCYISLKGNYHPKTGEIATEIVVIIAMSLGSWISVVVLLLVLLIDDYN